MRIFVFNNLSCLLQGLQRYGMQRRGKFAINTNLQLTIFSLKKYNIFAVTFITIDHTFTISVLIKVTIHITPPWRSSSLAKFIIPLLLFPCYVRNILFRFHFYCHHGCTLIILKHLSDPRWGWFQEKIVQWKQIRDQKLNLGSTMGSFSTPNSLSQHHFLCFSAKRGRADPFPNYLTKIKEVRPIIFQDLIEWIDNNPKIWNIFVQFPEVGRILTHFPLYQASIFSIESHPIQFSGSLLIPISSILESCNPTYLNPTSLNNSKVCQTFHHF